MADGGKGNAIMIAIGKAKKKPSFDRDQDAASGSDADTDEGGGHSEDEMTAMHAFENATSAEDKLDALKTIIKLCTEEDY